MTWLHSIETATLNLITGGWIFFLWLKCHLQTLTHRFISTLKILESHSNSCFCITFPLNSHMCIKVLEIQCKFLLLGLYWMVIFSDCTLMSAWLWGNLLSLRVQNTQLSYYHEDLRRKFCLQCLGATGISHAMYNAWCKLLQFFPLILVNSSNPFGQTYAAQIPMKRLCTDTE